MNLAMECISDVFFFFSSRRRHTRCSRDWSSDVCSSDLFAAIWPVFIRRRVQEHVRHSMAARALEGLCVLLVADDHGDPGRQFACLDRIDDRSEEHTSELQSRLHLVCRLLLEKKKRRLAESAYRSPCSSRTMDHAIPTRTSRCRPTASSRCEHSAACESSRPTASSSIKSSATS